MWIFLSLKMTDHSPVNNACAVPACVTVGRVLSSSIGESGGEDESREWVIAGLVKLLPHTFPFSSYLSSFVREPGVNEGDEEFLCPPLWPLPSRKCTLSSISCGSLYGGWSGQMATKGKVDICIESFKQGLKVCNIANIAHYFWHKIERRNWLCIGNTVF